MRENVGLALNPKYHRRRLGVDILFEAVLGETHRTEF